MSDEAGETHKVDLKAIRANQGALEPIISIEQEAGEKIVQWLVNLLPTPEPTSSFTDSVLARIKSQYPTSK